MLALEPVVSVEVSVIVCQLYHDFVVIIANQCFVFDARKLSEVIALFIAEIPITCRAFELDRKTAVLTRLIED